MSSAKPEFCLIGAPLDSGNLGVSALGISFLAAVAQYRPDAVVTVFDYGRGSRPGRITFDDQPLDYRLQGAMHTKRLYRREAYMRMRVDGWLGGLGNPGVSCIRNADAVFDVSGGDSFSDIYGHWRFRAVTLPKLIAIEQGTPLILLPQTYGPFDDASCRMTAAYAINQSKQVWARDEASYARLKDLMRPEHRDRMKLGVDMAFALPLSRPSTDIGERSLRFIDDSHHSGRHVISLNVSGLLMNDEANAPQQRSMQENYRKIIEVFLRRVLQKSDAAVLLMPHVIATGESDIIACDKVYRMFEADFADRVLVAHGLTDPRDVKAVISKCQWTCATRMHASIAGLSTGVPTAGLAYSDKMQPVFARCGVGDQVFDVRTESADDIIENMWDSWNDRQAIRKRLHDRMPAICRDARSQMQSIIESAIDQPAPVASQGTTHTAGRISAANRAS